MVSAAVNKLVNNKTKKANTNNSARMNNKAKTNKTNILKKAVNKNKKAPHISGGFDLTPLISAILLAGIKLSIKQNKKVVEKSKSSKSTKSTKSSKSTKSTKSPKLSKTK
jgi:hypothetical protein